MSSHWGRLIPDLWRHLAENYLSLGSLRTIARLNSRLLELSRHTQKDHAGRLEDFHFKEEAVARKTISLSFQASEIMALFPLAWSPKIIIFAVRASQKVCDWNHTKENCH